MYVRFTGGGLSSPSLPLVSCIKRHVAGGPSVSCINEDMSQAAAVLVLDKYE